MKHLGSNPFTRTYLSRKLTAMLVLAIMVIQPGVLQHAALAQAPAATNPWPVITLQNYASGLQAPTYLSGAGDSSGRIYVTEQAGKVRVLENGSLLPTPFLDITSRVLSGGERGLLSIAFPPNYAQKQYFYVFYTGLEGELVISRFYVSGITGLADPASERVILTIPHPGHSNHNGGQLAFGPDGYLYIGTGDGGGGGDPDRNGQDLGSLLGKILRIDTEMAGTAAAPNTRAQPAAARVVTTIYLPFVVKTGVNGGPAYQIPADNPFRTSEGARPEIWAYGLRNPWRFSFDSQTGDLYIADVGQSEFEEVDFQAAGSPGGQNYGWNIMEGFHCYNATTCDQAGKTLPVAEYSHGTNDSTGCSITGGFVYRGSPYAGLAGFYFFTDYCTGRIWVMQADAGAWQMKELTQVSHNFSSFGEDDDHNLYLVDIASGEVLKVAEGQ